MNMQDDPLNLQRLTAAVSRLEQYMQHTIQPTLDGEMMAELDRLRKLNDTLSDRHTAAKEKIDQLIHTLQQQGLKT